MPYQVTRSHEHVITILSKEYVWKLAKKLYILSYKRYSTILVSINKIYIMNIFLKICLFYKQLKIVIRTKYNQF